MTEQIDLVSVHVNRIFDNERIANTSTNTINLKDNKALRKWSPKKQMASQYLIDMNIDKNLLKFYLTENNQQKLKEINDELYKK